MFIQFIQSALFSCGWCAEVGDLENTTSVSFGEYTVLTPPAHLCERSQEATAKGDRQPLRAEFFRNVSPLPAPATRGDVEVQRADRTLPNEPGDVSSALHCLL